MTPLHLVKGANMAKTKETAVDNGKVKLVLPRARAGEEPNLFVCINGVNYLIPKGKSVEVPAFVAKEIERSMQAEDFYHDAAEALQNQTN